MTPRISTLITTLFIVTSTAAAASDARVNSSALEPLFACQALADPLERVDCFDREVSALKGSSEEGKVIVLDEASIADAKERSFGLPSLSLPRLTVPSLVSDEDDLIVAVSSWRHLPRSQYLEVTLSNGQVWQQTTGRKVFVPQGTLTSTISPAAFGSYMLAIENETGRRKGGIRVKRVE